MFCGLRIRLHPTFDILCREDGAILTRYGWKFGTVNSRGYLIVRLADNKTYSVHRLIAEAFISNPENKPTVDHIDRNKLNNFVSNLRWATISEQIRNRTIVDEEIRKYGIRRCEDQNAYNRARRRLIKQRTTNSQYEATWKGKG